jgi:hypothetical protein
MEKLAVSNLIVLCNNFLSLKLKGIVFTEEERFAYDSCLARLREILNEESNANSQKEDRDSQGN